MKVYTKNKYVPFTSSMENRILWCILFEYETRSNVLFNANVYQIRNVNCNRS